MKLLSLWYFTSIKELISAAIIGYHIFLGFTGAIIIIVALFIVKDWYRCKRYRMESEREEING